MILIIMVESISIADQKLNRENKQEAMKEENIKQLKREVN